MFAFTVTLNDPTTFADDALLIANVTAAAADWSRYINGSGTIDIDVNIVTTATGRASGAPAVAVEAGTDGARTVYQFGTLSELITGVDPNGAAADLIIEIDPAYLTTRLWLDPDFSDPAPGPTDRVDAYTVFRHEIGHGLGITGYRDALTGALPATYESIWDRLVEIRSGGAWFVGETARALYGGDVPVTTLSNGQGFYHLGNGPEDVSTDLMNGVVFIRGVVYDISPLDVALLVDLGARSDLFPVGDAGANALAGTADDNVLRGLDGDDTSEGRGGNDVHDGGPGRDAAIFTGPIEDYTISRSGASIIVVDGTAGRDGTDTLRNIEIIRFADRSIDVGMAALAASIDAATLDLLIERYVAYFNRVPEANGLSFWIERFKSGETLSQISEQFYEAGVLFSSVTGYSASLPIGDFIRIVYANVLSRSGSLAPPAEDVMYWENQIGTGVVTREGLIQRMLSDARLFAGDPTWGFVTDLLNNKVALGRYHGVTLGLDYESASEAITTTVGLAAAVTPTGIADAVAMIGLADNVLL